MFYGDIVFLQMVLSLLNFTFVYWILRCMEFILPRPNILYGSFNERYIYYPSLTHAMTLSLSFMRIGSVVFLNWTRHKHNVKWLNVTSLRDLSIKSQNTVVYLSLLPTALHSHTLHRPPIYCMACKPDSAVIMLRSFLEVSSGPLCLLLQLMSEPKNTRLYEGGIGAGQGKEEVGLQKREKIRF